MTAAVKRIAIFGPESTGKTQLAETLAAHFHVPLVPEYAREFWDQRGAIGLEDMGPIAREQWRREDAAAEIASGARSRAGRMVICDTDALTTMLWSNLLYGHCPVELQREAERRARRYARYLLLDIDVPFVPDPQRCFPAPEDRVKGMHLWRGALEERQLPFDLIRGDWANRARTAIDAVRRVVEG